MNHWFSEIGRHTQTSDIMTLREQHTKQHDTIKPREDTGCDT